MKLSRFFTRFFLLVFCVGILTRILNIFRNEGKKTSNLLLVDGQRQQVRSSLRYEQKPVQLKKYSYNNSFTGISNTERNPKKSFVPKDQLKSKETIKSSPRLRYRNMTDLNDNKTKSLLIQKPSKQALNYYQEWENTLRKEEITWGEFVKYSQPSVRIKNYIKPRVLNSLRKCKNDGEILKSGLIKGCIDIWSDEMISTWKNKKIDGLCEENANSKIKCFDSTVGKSRFCIFENAMMNFRKVRRKKSENSYTRSWERGFLSADCGEMAPDDINYLTLYKPDIEGRDDAICDYYFNETVIAYSHENIRNFGNMILDYMNVWVMMFLAGLSQESKDITFLNIDSIRKGKYFNDQPNQFFRIYYTSFRRIFRGIDFWDSKKPQQLSSKVCFKKLLMQPRPTISYQFGENHHFHNDSKCKNSEILRNKGRSSILQRYNLQIRQNYNLLQDHSKIPTNQRIQLLLIYRSLPKNYTSEQALQNNTIKNQRSDFINSRIFSNIKDIISGLNELVGKHKNTNLPINLLVQDVSTLSFEHQLHLISNSSLIIGMHGIGMANIIHMAIGTKYCCGVIEIFPHSSHIANQNLTTNLEKGSENAARRVRGHGMIARRLGVLYERMDLLEGSLEGETGSFVSVPKLKEVVDRTVLKLANDDDHSCFLTSVLDKPYL